MKYLPSEPSATNPRSIFSCDAYLINSAVQLASEYNFFDPCIYKSHIKINLNENNAFLKKFTRMDHINLYLNTHTENNEKTILVFTDSTEPIYLGNLTCLYFDERHREQFSNNPYIHNVINFENLKISAKIVFKEYEGDAFMHWTITFMLLSVINSEENKISHNDVKPGLMHSSYLGRVFITDLEDDNVNLSWEFDVKDKCTEKSTSIMHQMYLFPFCCKFSIMDIKNKLEYFGLNPSENIFDTYDCLKNKYNFEHKYNESKKIINDFRKVVLAKKNHIYKNKSLKIFTSIKPPDIHSYSLTTIEICRKKLGKCETISMAFSIFICFILFTLFVIYRHKSSGKIINDFWIDLFPVIFMSIAGILFCGFLFFPVVIFIQGVIYFWLTHVFLKEEINIIEITNKSHTRLREFESEERCRYNDWEKRKDSEYRMYKVMLITYLCMRCKTPWDVDLYELTSKINEAVDRRLSSQFRDG